MTASDPVQQHACKAAQLARARSKALLTEKNTDAKAQEATAGMPAGRKAEIIKLLATMPRSCRPAYVRAVSGRSRSAAIRAFCNECMGWEGLPWSVRSCTAPACALYSYRPGANR